jgi:hypothetical protein
VLSPPLSLPCKATVRHAVLEGTVKHGGRDFVQRALGDSGLTLAAAGATGGGPRACPGPCRMSPWVGVEGRGGPTREATASRGLGRSGLRVCAEASAAPDAPLKAEHWPLDVLVFLSADERDPGARFERLR